MNTSKDKTPSSETDLGAQLRDKGLSNTSARRKLLKAFQNSAHPLSITELSKKFKFTPPNVTTLYRNVAHLEKAGLLAKVELQDKIDRYELSAQTQKHHHHVMCRNCQNITCIPVCIPKELTAQVSKFGFTNIEHQLQFSALCKDCI